MSLANANYTDRHSFSERVLACDDGHSHHCSHLLMPMYMRNLHITSGALNLLNNANLTNFKWLFTMAWMDQMAAFTSNKLSRTFKSQNDVHLHGVRCHYLDY